MAATLKRDKNQTYVFAYANIIIIENKVEMVPQTLNMVDVVIRNIRIFKVQKSGELRDKLVKDVSLSCEYDPQGINIKLIAGI